MNYYLLVKEDFSFDDAIKKRRGCNDQLKFSGIVFFEDDKGLGVRTLSSYFDNENVGVWSKKDNSQEILGVMFCVGRIEKRDNEMKVDSVKIMDIHKATPVYLIETKGEYCRWLVGAFQKSAICFDTRRPLVAIRFSCPE